MIRERSENLREWAKVILVLGLVAGMLSVAFGVFQLFESLAAGLPALVGGILLIVLAAGVHLLVTVLTRMDSYMQRIDFTAEETSRHLTDLRPLLENLAADEGISDRVKSVVHREAECDALRNAVRSHVLKSEWENAYYVIDQMDKAFGMHVEAAQFLREIEKARRDVIEVKLEEALRHIDSLLAAREWERVDTEIARLQRLFPDNEQVRGLTPKVAASRQAHKQELLAEWDAAVSRSDVDRGIEILRDLDTYLSKKEAAQLADSARDVFKAKLVNLGVQFGLAVNEQRWRNALEVGLQIIDEFPNSRMAREVEGKLEAMRLRAGLVADVTMGPGSGA